MQREILLERRESLEQLRALENGIRIRVLQVAQAAPSVDTPEDAERVARIFERIIEPRR